MKQFSQAYEGNKDDILPVLTSALPGTGTVLEVGSGTGQHAVFFAARLPQVQWQPTDLAANIPSIAAWTEDAALANVRAPLVLDLLGDAAGWPVTRADAVVCINTVHIVAWPGVVNLFTGAGRVLVPGGVLYLYGAYRYATRAFEPSNAAFDAWLKARDPASGVRDFEAVHALAQQNGLMLASDVAMASNNRSLVWRKV